ncbi:MAG: DUF4198 domain-containing protein [Polaromonas sp.]|nr:DUF4198 domain-containing protein [Polaromonas sp.]
MPYSFYKPIQKLITPYARLALAALLMSGLSVHAHEFWFTPVTAPLAAGDSASLTLHVGEFFEGDVLGFSAQQTVALRQYSASGATDLRALLPRNSAVPALLVPVLTPGTHMVVFNSQPNFISLPAGSFHAYLHDEGLDFIKAQREAAGSAEKPGRERYRRFVKTLMRVAPGTDTAQSAAAKPDTTHATRTGQRLEILPSIDPMAMVPGEALGVRVEFDGKPLEGALLKAWHKRGGQMLIIRAKTAADGSASFDLPYAGPWMISVVHMIPAVSVKDVDWDSLWANLSFNLAPK